MTSGPAAKPKPVASAAVPVVHEAKVARCGAGNRRRACVSEAKNVCSVPTIAVPNQPARFCATCAPSR
jgi:hypothetical protein